MADEAWGQTGQESSPIDIDRLLGIARRQWRVVAASVIVAVVIGIAYLLTATPLYSAKTTVMIDRGNDSLVQQVTSLESLGDDESSVLSQVELLKSETIAAAVVSKLKLDQNAEFMAEDGSLLRSARIFLAKMLNPKNWFGSADLETTQAEDNRQTAIDKVVGSTAVARVGRSYVLEISFTSPSPQLAAQVANGIGDAYLIDKLDSKFDATRRASSWLLDRISELRQKSLESDLAVQRFRSDNNLLSAGNMLLSEQQLSELNSALITARGDTAKAQANYDRIESIIKAGDPQAIVVDALANPVVTSLRQKYVEVSKRRTEIQQLLGDGHVQVQRLTREMEEYQRLMFDELGRIAESFKSELEVTTAREKSLEESLSQATTVSATANETQVQLRELERESQTYRNLYSSFLDRYQQALQQQSFPVTDSRVISRATEPDRPSAPKKPLAMALFIALGMAAGGMLGAFREYRDRFFRTGEQIRTELGLEPLGIAPLVDNVAAGAPAQQGALANPRALSKTSSISDYVIDHPLSAFAEALRSAKIAVDLTAPSKPCKIVGILSTLPDEGKSTVSVNFAELLASQGARTLLIDSDLRNPGATRMLAPAATAGLLEVLIEGRPVENTLMINPRTNLAFLPAVVKQRVPHSSELLNSSEMQRILALLSSKFDYIILDLPPLAPVVDARAIASRVDGFMYVVEWGKTSRSTVRHTLLQEARIVEKCIGVLLNKVDMEKMKLYRAYGTIDYYYSRYSRYYHER